MKRDILTFIPNGHRHDNEISYSVQVKTSLALTSDSLTFRNQKVTQNIEYRAKAEEESKKGCP